jgi:hypothetical protein
VSGCREVVTAQAFFSLVGGRVGYDLHLEVVVTDTGGLKVSALLYSKVEVLYNFHIKQMFEALKEPGDTLIAAMPTICIMN